MGLTERGDEAIVTASARELNNIIHYRGLSMNQGIQALVAASAAYLVVYSNDKEDLLEWNLKMFCRQVRMRSRNAVRARGKKR